MATYRFDEIAINSTKKKKPTEEDKVHYIGLEHIDPGCFNIVRWGSDVAPTGDKLLMQKGDVLFGKRRAYQRKVGIAPFDGIFSAHGMVLRPNTEIIDANYFPFFISSDRFMETAVRISVGGLSPTINWKDLAKQEFDLPPLEEQKVLADKLWAAYRLKEGYKKLLVATDEMVKSQFIEMFSSYQTTPVGNYIEDSYPGEWGTEDKDGNGVKVVRTTNFTNSGKLDLTDVVTRSISEKKIERKTIRKYDTILERSGGTTDNPVGRVVLFEEDEQYLCNNFTQVLRFKKVNPIFAFYSLFYFYHTNKIVVRSMGSKTTGIQNLNMSKYLEIGIPNASDDEQKKFVAIAKQADKSKFGDFKSQFIEMFGNTSKEMLGKFIQVVRGVSYKPSDVKTADDPDTAVILRSNNINDANLNTDEVVYINKNRVSGDQYLRVNDIVVCASNGSKALVGKAAINKTLTNQYAHGAFCLLVRPNDNINPVYLNTFFQTSLYKKQIDELAAGSNILNIKQEYLTNMILPLPIIEEQNKFAIIAEQADKSKSYVRIALKNLESILGYCIRQVA